MSILGIVIRTHPAARQDLAARLTALPGCELGPEAGPGRLVAVLESTPQQPAAAVMGDIAHWPEVLSLSLVYEHTGLDADCTFAQGKFDFRSWRQDVREFAREQAQLSRPDATQPPPSISAD